VIKFPFLFLFCFPKETDFSPDIISYLPDFYFMTRQIRFFFLISYLLPACYRYKLYFLVGFYFFKCFIFLKKYFYNIFYFLNLFLILIKKNLQKYLTTSKQTRLYICVALPVQIIIDPGLRVNLVIHVKVVRNIFLTQYKKYNINSNYKIINL